MIALEPPGELDQHRPHERARATVTLQPAEFEVRVSGIVPEAHDVLSLELVLDDGRPLPAWEPGAHLDLILPSGLERQYSLCGDPSAGSWRVAVLREHNGRGGSQWVHDQLAEGHALTVRGPRNNFGLVDAEHYLLIGGGIGITPLLPMAELLARRGVPWKLLYGGRERRSMAFVERLSVHGDRMLLRPQDEFGLLELDPLLRDFGYGGAVYCCGPEPLLIAVEQATSHLPPGSLHVERFHPREGALDAPNSAFEVVLDRTGITLQVGPEQTILEVVEAAGVSVPTSCREGTCGSCETEVLEGEVDHRDSFLTEAEREEGLTMQICCSRARSQRIVLDL